MHLTLRFASLLAVTLAACLPPSEEPPTDTPAATQLAVEIGPEGGELQAPADSPLAGVRLRVPAGAVATKTTFTIDGQLAATQLSGAAEQVGPQFIIGPADAIFAVPLELTVPIDLDLIARHEQGPDECKVWHLTGETWTRLERTSGTEDTVTVQLPSPGIAAAGVIARAGLGSCVTNPSSCRASLKPIVIGNNCVSPQGYCMSKLAEPSAAPVDLNPGFTVKGRQLFYAHVPATGQITVARYDLATGNTVLFTPHPVPGLSRIASTDIAVDANGDAWLGLEEHGNVRFGENKAPRRFDVASGQLGKGAVMVGNVAWRLVFKNGQTSVTDGTVTHFLANDVVSSAEPRPTEPTSFVAKRRGTPIEVNVTTGVATDQFTDVAANLSRELVASMVSDAFAVANAGPNSVALKRANGTTTSFVSNTKFLAFDADDLLHGVPLLAELQIFDSAGGQATVPLIGPNDEQPNHPRMLPHAMVAVPGRRELVLITAGSHVPRLRDFYLIQKAD